MSKNTKTARLPSKCCVVCERSLEEVGGGKRVIAQQLRGLVISTRFKGGGDPDYPQQSFPLGDAEGSCLLVWGEKELWTYDAIERARHEFLGGRRPWLCQLCARRECSECGAPINYPMGSDILNDNGCSSHVAMFPVDPGCTNTACKKYREWSL